MSGEGAPRRLHPGTILLRFVREAPSAVIPLVAAIGFARKGGFGWALLLAAAVAAVMLLLGWLGWRRFTYRIEAAEIVVESGILHRNRRSIPFARIQDVDIERRFLARLFGLAKVRIETGAGGKDEGTLDSVSMAEALRLRETVRARRLGEVPADAPAEAAPSAPLLYEMDVPRLLLFGLFSFSLAYVAGLFALLQTFDRLLPFDIYDPARWVGLAGEYLPHRWTVAAIGAVLFLAVLLGVVAGVVRTVSRDFGYRLTLEGGRFRREQGLLTRSEAVIARPRVQLAQVRSGPLRALFGWSALSFQTLGAGTDRSGRQNAAPFATRAEVEAVLAEAPPMRLPPPPALEPVSRRHILRSLAGRLLPLAAAIGGLSFLDPRVLAAAALLPFVAALAWAERRFHRYAFDGELLFVMRGPWRRRMWIVPVGRIQALSLSRGPVQRRLGLASLAIDTAGAPLVDAPRIVDLRRETAEALAAALRAAGQACSGRKSGTER